MESLNFLRVGEKKEGRMSREGDDSLTSENPVLLALAVDTKNGHNLGEVSTGRQWQVVHR